VRKKELRKMEICPFEMAIKKSAGQQKHGQIYEKKCMKLVVNPLTGSY